MRVGENQSLGIDHHTRALTALALGTGWWITQQIPQQRINQGRVKRLTFHGPFGVNPNHRWSDPPDGISNKAVLKGKSLPQGSQQHQNRDQNRKQA